MIERHSGRCHCGAIQLSLETASPLAPRACQCSFCRKHGARTLSDPLGTATIAASVAPILYRFASRAADYLLCPRCGVYLGAMTVIEGRRLATLNLNAFDDPRPDLTAVAVDYEGESAAARAERRRARWTPLRIVGAGAPLGSP